MEEPYELPEGWVWTTLGNIADVVTGNTPPKKDQENYGNYIPFVKPPELNDSVITKAADNLSEKGAKLARILPPDSILVSCIGILGKTGINKVPIAFNQQINAAIFSKNVHPKHGFYYFQTSEAKELLNKKSSSTTIPIVNKSRFKTLQFPLPPLNEQHRIVTKLEALLSQVNVSKEHLAKVPTLIKQFRQSVLAAAYSGELTKDWRKEHPDLEPARELLEYIFRRRLDEADMPAKKQKIQDIYSYREEQDSVLLPPGWEYITLDKLCKSFQYGTSKKSMPEGKISVLRMGNLQNGEIDWNDLVYTSNEEEIEKYSLEPGTVLFNRTNSPELVGKTAIYRGECPAIFAGYLIMINNYQELDSEYLNYSLNTAQAKEHCLRVKTDGVSQSNINAQKLGKFEIPFCSLEEQQEIVRCVDTLFKVVKSIEDCYNKANAQVDNLTQSLLAKAFRGELVPQDPNDEPASVLLERIEKERAEREKEKKHKKENRKCC